MRERLERAVAWIEERSLRERVLLLPTAVVLLFGLWDAVLMGPLEAERRLLANQLRESAEQSQALERQADEISRRLAESPELEMRRESERLEGEIRDLDERLAAHQLGLVPSSEMARVLEELLDRETGLRLLRLETLAPEIVLDAEDGESDDPAPYLLFQHDVAIEVEGSYFAALRYLRALETLPWRVHLDQLHYVVTEHPTARVAIQVYTLSSEEAWVGV